MTEDITEKTNLLFICSRNQWRSPTAEKVWKNHPACNTRSAGTSTSAKKTVNAADIHWADKILVMEKKHKNHLLAKFGNMLAGKEIFILDIADEYRYMDPELIEELQVLVSTLLGVDACR